MNAPVNAVKDWNGMDDEVFRLEVRQFFEENYPEELRFLTNRPHFELIKPWLMKLVAKGWSAPHWPAEFGGMGLGPQKLLIFMDEQSRWGVARQFLGEAGTVQLGPMLISHGSEDQKKNLLPRILRYDDVWCQGYSEPNAGSDLASLSLEARVEGDSIVLNGRKIWTSSGLDSTHLYLLARSNKEVKKKQDGISFILLDLSSPGVTVRGIRNISGTTEYCEIILDNVRTPLTNVVGKLHDGWTVSRSLMGFERINTGSPRRAEFAFKRLEALAVERGLFADAGFVERYTELALDLADLKSTYVHFADMLCRGETLGADLSVLQLLSAETNQRITECLLESSGELGLTVTEANSEGKRVDALTPFLVMRAVTIGAGTSEIHRDIIAKRVLNLPSK